MLIACALAGCMPGSIRSTAWHAKFGWSAEKHFDDPQFGIAFSRRGAELAEKHSHAVLPIRAIRVISGPIAVLQPRMTRMEPHIEPVA
jgi:hypothetical protein